MLLTQWIIRMRMLLLIWTRLRMIVCGGYVVIAKHIKPMGRNRLPRPDYGRRRKMVLLEIVIRRKPVTPAVTRAWGGGSVTPTLVTLKTPENMGRARILGMGKSSSGGKVTLQVGIKSRGLELESESTEIGPE